jgi:hypothetical protein
MQHKLFRVAAFAAFAGSLFGCKGEEQMIEAPKGILADLGQAEKVPEAKELTEMVDGLVQKDFSIVGSRFFKEDGRVSWSEVQLYVANQRDPNRTMTGGSAKAIPYGRVGLELINVYPAEGSQPAFAVAMRKEPLADGTKLVGYFTLKKKP